MCIVATDRAPTTPTPPPDSSPASAAAQLRPQERQRLALDALAGQAISDLARRHTVSRKFVYQQQQRAQDALDEAFVKPAPPPEQVLFQLPVTRSWLEQFVLALLLIGHCSLRGIHELVRDLLDYPLSVGTLHDLVHRTIARAIDRNARADLSRVLLAALDEIFQNGRPVLSVVDVPSTYCCLLSLEEHRDADTWGVRLLDLQQQGFAPQATLADGATGLRAGQALALPGIPCWADLFHPLRDLGQVVRFLENRAYAALAACDKLQRQTPAQQRRGGPTLPHAERLEQARAEQARAVALADEVAWLARWLRQDVLNISAGPLAQRRELFDFVLAELQQRQAQCPHRLGPVCRTLASQKEDLLAFAQQLDQDVSDLAAYAHVPPAAVRELLALQDLPLTNPQRWQRDQTLRGQLGERYHEVSQWVAELRGGVVRASSVVENVNSRLRNYFFLRREVGGGYLDLLRFFLNHRRFLRSEHPERVGKSPAELLTGQPHGHWLELLGYQRFQQAA
jgi:hypothetical protein